MNSPFEYYKRFVRIRIVCPKTHKVHLEVQRAVDVINNEPDWDELDGIVGTFLESNTIDCYTRLAKPDPQTAGGWVTHTFDMGCPRLVWVLPDPSWEGGS